MYDDAIVIMAKYPSPGNSKTRLGKYIGYDKSAKISQALLEDTWNLSTAYTKNVYICCPKKDETLFELEYPEMALLVPEKDSGCIHDSINGIENLFDTTTSTKAVIISSDTPSLDSEFFERVFDELDDNRYVAGFNRDKRPYVLGMNKRFVDTNQKQILKHLPDYATDIFLPATYYIFKKPFFKVHREDEKIDIDTCRDLADIGPNIDKGYKKTANILSEYTVTDSFVFDLCAGMTHERNYFSSNMPISAIATKNNKICSSGSRFETGLGKHAEHCLIEKATKNDLRNSTIYVTLEPCSERIMNITKGCAYKIAESGVKRVIFGEKDKNPKVKGMEVLEALGIDCFQSPVFEDKLHQCT